MFILHEMDKLTSVLMSIEWWNKERQPLVQNEHNLLEIQASKGTFWIYPTWYGGYERKLFYFHHNSTWFLLSRLVFYFIFTKAESQDDIRGNEFAPKRHYKGNSKLKLRILKLFRLHCKPIPCNENRVLPVKFSHREIPVMKTGVPAMRTGVPCNENRFFSVWKLSIWKVISTQFTIKFVLMQNPLTQIQFFAWI